MPPEHVSGIGTLFYTHSGKAQETVHVHAMRVGRIPYANTVNIYKVEKGKDPSTAKLAMFGITLTTSNTSFNLGHVKVKPGDRLYALMDRKGLTFKAVIHRTEPVDPFNNLFG